MSVIVKKASELAKILGGTLEGADVELVACAGLEEARPGVDPSAIVDKSVKLGKNVHVGPLAVIRRNAVIGDDAVIEAQVFIGEGCTVGAIRPTDSTFAPVPSSTTSSTESTAFI